MSQRERERDRERERGGREILWTFFYDKLLAVPFILVVNFIIFFKQPEFSN